MNCLNTLLSKSITKIRADISFKIKTNNIIKIDINVSVSSIRAASKATLASLFLPAERRFQ